MSLLGFDAVGLGLLAVVVLGIVFAVDLLLEGLKPDMALERTLTRSKGVAGGVGGMVMVALAFGVEVAMQLPEIVLTLFGVYAIINQIDWQMFLALSIAFYVVAQTVETRVRGWA